MGTSVKIDLPPGSVTVDISDIIEWLRKDPTAEVARRFIKLFKDHGIMPTQIQRVLPSVTLNALRNRDILTAALTNDVLEKCAALFGVQRSWLEAVTDKVYPFRSCYKNPEAFCQEIARMSKIDVWAPLRVYCLDQQLDRQSGKHQPLVVVMVEKACDWDGDDVIERYRPFTVPWYWDDPVMRIPLKAMLRIAYDEFGITNIPLISTSRSDFALLAEGKLIPPVGLPRLKSYIEDYVLSPDESAVSKEGDELETVQNYIEQTGFRELARKAITDRQETSAPKKGKRRK